MSSLPIPTPYCLMQSYQIQVFRSAWHANYLFILRVEFIIFYFGHTLTTFFVLKYFGHTSTSIDTI
jgi:hypothetical protein